MKAAKLQVLKPKEAEKLERIANILKTIAHPLRLGIVHILELHSSLAVNEICELLNSEQSLTSHHLQIMRLNGILTVKRDGRSKMYSLKDKELSKIITCLDNCKINI